MKSFFSVAIHHIVNGTFVVLFENVYIQYVFADKHLVGYTNHFVFSVFIENNHIINVRAIGHKLVFLQACADKTFFAVDIKLLVSFDYLCCFYGIEIAQLGASRIILAIFFLQHLIPVYGIIDDMRQFIINVFYFFFDAGDVFVCFIFIEFQNTCHFDFHQFQDIFFRYFPDKLRIEWGQTFVDVCTGRIHIFRLFESYVFINAFFDEYLFKRGKMKILQKLSFAYFQFLTKQGQCIVYRFFQYVTDSEKVWLACINHTAVR